MKQITTSKGVYIFVEESLFDSQWYNLPDGKYILLCTTDTITEDIAKGIVDNFGIHPVTESYKNYEVENTFFYNAIDSFKSLLQSHNLSLDKIYTICKQN